MTFTPRRTLFTVFPVLCSLLLAGIHPAWAEVSAAELVKDGKTLVVLRNPFETLTFEPARGGRCISFRFLDNNEELIDQNPMAGMFLDHWAKYPWPSGLMHLPYQYTLLTTEKGKVGIRLWVTVPAMGGGKGTADAKSSAAIQTSPELIGLVMKKTIWLYDATDRIDVEQTIENPTNEARSVSPYVQHNFNMAGSRYADTWYLPSTQGVVWNIQPGDEKSKIYGPNWVLDPVAGWMGVRDRNTNRGLLFAFDYNYLEKIYTCGSTAEWFMESVPVAAGKSFTTKYVIKPEQGFDGFIYGSASLMADLQAHEQGKQVLITHDLAAVQQALGPLEVTITLQDWKSKQVYLTQSYTVPKLTNTKLRQEFTATPKNLIGGTVIAVTVKGEGVNERYEFYYAGDTNEHERHYNYFAAGGGALVGAQGDTYHQKAPRKIKQIDKPDFAKIAGPAAGQFHCMVTFGLYTETFNFDDNLAGWMSKDGAAPQFDFINAPPNGIESFPGGYEALFAYNTVIISNTNYRALGDIRLEMLCDYVAQGGKLLVTGGPYALGNGEYEGTRLLDLLPATLSGPFDMKWAGKGKSWLLTAAPDGKDLLNGVSFAQTPRVYWQHAVTPKKNTRVILTAGGKPSLIIGRYGKGKVALLTLSPTGAPAAGETAWWAWDGWQPLLNNIMTWLNS
jgi:uncharacterized membrane protein